MAASAILLVDVSYEGLAALKLPPAPAPYVLALLDYNTQRINSAELCGHLKRVYADGGRPRDGFRRRRQRPRSKPTPPVRSFPRWWGSAA
jgi:hypothetical protein